MCTRPIHQNIEYTENIHLQFDYYTYIKKITIFQNFYNLKLRNETFFFTSSKVVFLQLLYIDISPSKCSFFIILVRCHQKIYFWHINEKVTKPKTLKEPFFSFSSVTRNGTQISLFTGCCLYSLNNFTVPFCNETRCLSLKVLYTIYFTMVI